MTTQNTGITVQQINQDWINGQTEYTVDVDGDVYFVVEDLTDTTVYDAQGEQVDDRDVHRAIYSVITDDFRERTGSF